MNSQRLRQHTQGLHGSAPVPLHIHYGFQFSVFMGFLNVQLSGSLSLLPSLGLFSFCLFCLIPMCKFLFYLIIFYFITIPKKPICFLVRMDMGERGDGEELRAEEGREIVIRTYYVRKKSIFNKRNKKMRTCQHTFQKEHTFLSVTSGSGRQYSTYRSQSLAVHN